MSGPISIDELVAAARRRLDRVPAGAVDERRDAGTLLVDIRPAADRDADGEMPGAVPIEQNVVLWRLAPSSPTRAYDVGDGRQVILFCNDGYTSSLVAATLHDLGVTGATDIVGGYRGWRAHGGG